MKTAVDGPLAECDIVLFGSREVSQGGWPNLGRDDTEIAGDASCEDDAGFGFAVGDDFFHVGGGDKSFHDLLGFIGGGDQIEVFDDLLSASEAACDFGLADGWAFPEVIQKGLGSGQGST